MSAIVIGAGIGGLTAALSLNAAGFDVRVFESVADIKGMGFGINLQPNAVRELTELGLGDALADTAIETAELGYYNKHGQLIWSEPRGRAAGYAWPQYAIDRGALQLILLDAVKARIGAQNVLTGHHLVGFEQDGSGVAAFFVDRPSGQPLPPRRGDVLIGCDGIHSTVRAQLYPHEGPPVKSGRLHWRGVLEAEPFLGGRTHATMGFSDRRAVVYPMSRKAADRGRSRISWVVNVTADEFPSRQRSAWGDKVSKDRVCEAFGNWNFSWLDFPGLVGRTDDIYEYPEADRDPLPQWSFGRVTLIGDAAHPMRPTGAQAGSQAIVDARFLAFALATTRTVERALEDYDEQRRPIMNAVTMVNRRFGPAIVMELAEQRAPQGFNDIENVITRRELEQISWAYKVEAGLDPAALNERQSLTIPQSIWPVARRVTREIS
jgi:2-polyprenyl-6-methoxyphenol hydroxylase-like FAD-dependent oxidoreductase